MDIIKKDLHDIIEYLSEDQLKSLRDYAYQLKNKHSQKDNFKEAFEYAVSNFDKSLRELKDK